MTTSETDPAPRGGAMHGSGWVGGVASDFRFAARMLLRSPGFTAVAVVSLALGIGPNTAIFSLVQAVLFQEWGVDDPERIVDVYTLTEEGEYYYSYHSVFELVDEGATDVFEAVTQHSMYAGRIEAGDGTSELVLGEMVAGNYFDVMGVRAQLGRTFVGEEDATEGTHPVLVLGDHYWRSRYAADPRVVGSEIRLNGRPYTVIGIAPADYRGRIAPGIGTDFWVPFRMFPHLSPGKMNSGDLTVTARTRPGVTPGQGIAAVETLGARYDAELDRENPERRSRFALAAFSLADVRLHPGVDGILTSMALLLGVTVALVLLVACVNLAGFLLSRATDRRREMAIRVAMGAGRGTIVRQLLVESLLLAGMGAALGLALGQLAVRALAAADLPDSIPIPLELEVGLSLPTLLFTTGLAVVAAVLFGLTPAFESTRAPVASTLRDEAGSSAGRRKSIGRSALVGSQMALSTVLVFGAVLFLRSLDAATDIDVGFSTEPAAVVKVESGTNEYTPEQQAVFVDEIERRLAAHPSVTDFGVTVRMPLDLGVRITTFDTPGVEPPPGRNRHRYEHTLVTPGYFSAMRIPILEGRGFTTTDREGTRQVAVLSRAGAERLWPGESAVGKVLYRGGDTEDVITVVGVAGDVKIWSLSEAPMSYLYLPFRQGASVGTFYVTARGPVPAGELAATVLDEARAIDPEIFMTQVGTLADHLGYAYFLPRLAALLLTLVGVLALVIASTGLFGMVSYTVSRRTREMGIRLALGAERQAVVRLVLARGLTVVALGGAAGMAVSIAVGRLAEGFLVGIPGLDPLALLGAPAILLGVALLAALLPARRASRVDPVRALRTE